MPAATASATMITPAAIHHAVVLLTWAGADAGTVCLGVVCRGAGAGTVCLGTVCRCAGAGTVGETGLSARSGIRAGTVVSLGTGWRRCCFCARPAGTVAAFVVVFF
ncbi:hypothetical protein GCM10027610_132870 [Dactylosporangium cerinum]